MSFGRTTIPDRFQGRKIMASHRLQSRARKLWGRDRLDIGRLLRVRPELECLERRDLPSTLPSTLSFTATNMDFTSYTNEPVASPMPIPQFDTMGGARALTSVEIISSIGLN